jgi:hypothetical protein
MASSVFFLTIVPLQDNVEKYGTYGQDTDDNVTRRIRFACWITKATSINSEYTMLIVFPL